MLAVELAPLLFIAFLAVGITLAVYGWRAAQKRREELRALARELGLRFSPEHDGRHDDRYPQFDVFQRGHSRYAYDTLRGDVELFGQRCRLIAGDYHYETDDSDKKSTTTHTFSFLIVHPPWRTPRLLVRPEGLLDKLAGLVGFEDIDFESAEFSKRFFVKATDKRFAYDVLHPRMMEFLLAERPPMFELEDGALCLSDGSSHWRVDTLRARLAFVQRFAALWPRHLVQDLAAATGTEK